MRNIVLRDNTQCGVVNPFFVTRVTVSGRRLFDFTEKIDIAEFFPFPVGPIRPSQNIVNELTLSEIFSIISTADKKVSLSFEERVDASEFKIQQTNQISARFLRFIDGVNLIEGNN